MSSTLRKISHILRLCCTAQFVALGAAFSLSACGSVQLFGQYDLPEDPAVERTPWPRLVDTPAAPEVGSFSDKVPDPAVGARTQTDLSAAAVFAERRRDEVAGPVISDAERDRLFRNAVKNREQAAE